MMLEHEEILIFLLALLVVGVAAGIILLKILPAPLYIPWGEGGQSYPIPMVHVEPANRDAKLLAQVMEYAKDHVFGDRKCHCGERCQEYANYLVKYSQQFEIPDPLLPLSIMMQESSCETNPVSEKGCIGLMQICSWDLCKPIGITQKEELWDAEENIKCGIYILLKKYETYGITKRKCGPYTDPWHKAVRGYVGCKMSIHPDYVPEVFNRYYELKAYYEQISAVA